MHTFRRRLGPSVALVSVMLALAACEENTAPVITKFRVTPECSNLTEHRQALVDENGDLILDDEGNPIFEELGTYAEVQFFARASGGNEESDPTGANTPIQWEWSFGDGTGASNVVSGVHRYVASGRYEVTLTVKDKDGETATAASEIVVGEVGGEIDILSLDITSEREGRYQSSFDAGGLTRCDFRAWRYTVHGVLETPCLVTGLTEQYDWKWQHRNQQIEHVSDLVQDYNFPGPHQDLFVLSVTELSSETSRVDTLQVTIPADELPFAALRGVSISSNPVPKFADNAGNCEFVGYDVVLSGSASTRCGTLLRATQFEWNWAFSDGSQQPNTAQVSRSYAFDPQNPGERTDAASLRVTETVSNPQGQTQQFVEETLIQFVVPAGPVSTIRRVDIEQVDIDPDPRRTILADPLWDQVPDGQGGFTCEFVGWDVLFDVEVLTGCGPTTGPTAQFQWQFDYGDGMQATDPVSPQRHRYLYDPSAPGTRRLTATLVVTDRVAGTESTKALLVQLPSAPTSIPSPCPDNAKR